MRKAEAQKPKETTLWNFLLCTTYSRCTINYTYNRLQITYPQPIKEIGQRHKHDHLEFGIFSATEKQMAGKEWGRFYVTGMKQAPTICILWIRTKTSTQQVQPPANMPHDKNNTEIKRVHHHKIKEKNCGFSYEWIN